MKKMGGNRFKVFTARLLLFFFAFYFFTGYVNIWLKTTALAASDIVIKAEDFERADYKLGTGVWKEGVEPPADSGWVRETTNTTVDIVNPGEEGFGSKALGLNANDSMIWTVDTTGYSNIKLEFWWKSPSGCNTASSTSNVSYSTDGTSFKLLTPEKLATWNTAEGTPNTFPDFQKLSYELPAEAENISALKIKFKVGSFGTAPRLLYIDNIKVMGQDSSNPTAPTNLELVSKTSDSVLLSWIKSTDNTAVAGYKVYNGTDEMTGAVIQAVDENVYTAALSGLAAGSYSFSVRAFDAAGNLSDPSNTIVVNVGTSDDEEPPTAPTDLSLADKTHDSVTLHWTAATDNVGVAGYSIYKDGVVMIGITYSSDGSGGFSAVISGLQSLTTYTFTVRAFDDAGNLSDFSAPLTVTTNETPDTTPPTVPSSLALVSRAESSVILRWNGSTDNKGVAGYQIFNNGVYFSEAEITSVVGNVYTATVSGLTPNTKYVFSVKAVDAAGNLSGASNSVTVYTDVQAPSTPGGLILESINSVTAVIKWMKSTDNVNVSGYKIYADGKELITSYYGEADENWYRGTLNYLAPNKTYQLGVSAVDWAGNESEIATINVTTTAVPATMEISPGVYANANSPLGMNLSKVTPAGTQYPFVDIFKYANKWNSSPSSAPIDLDEKGWVRSLQPGQRVSINCINSNEGHVPRGDYVCLYDGEGDIRFSTSKGVIIEKSREPGRVVFEFEPYEGLTVTINSTNPDNYIRNIRIIMPGFESTYETQPFHPLFLELFKKFSTIRFMDWERTNGSNIVRWSDRHTPDEYTQTNGVAIEYMIQLCNTLNANMWICIPHKADDDYVRNCVTGEVDYDAFFEWFNNDPGPKLLPDAVNNVKQIKEIVEERGLRLITYEGGQHLVASNNAYLDMFYGANNHPGMYETYRNLLSEWKALGGDMFVHYASITQTNSNGSWGCLESMDWDLNKAYKYNALVDFIDENPKWWTSLRREEIVNSTISPTDATFDKYSQSADYRDITVTVTTNGNTLVAIKNGLTALVEGIDYTASGEEYSIKKEYLATLDNGIVTLIFDMDAGEDPTLQIIVLDSTPTPIPAPDMNMIFTREGLSMTGSAKITGNTATNSTTENTVSFSGSAKIDGSLWIGPDADWTDIVKASPSNARNRITGDIFNLTESKEYLMPVFPDFPELPEKGDLNAGWWPAGPHIIEESGSYGSINVTDLLTFNIGDEDLQIVADTLTVTGSGKIVVNRNGEGRLILYIRDRINITGSSKINQNGSYDDVFAYYAGSETPSFGGSTQWVGSLYAKDASITLSGSGGVTGHIVSGGSAVIISGNAEANVRAIYAPNALLTLSGSSKIKGAVVVRSIQLSGSAQITYSDMISQEFFDQLIWTEPGQN